MEARRLKIKLVLFYIASPRWAWWRDPIPKQEERYMLCYWPGFQSTNVVVGIIQPSASPVSWEKETDVGALVSPHVSSSCSLKFDQNLCGEMASKISMLCPWGRPARLIMLSVVPETQILPPADFYFLTISEHWTKTNLFDGLLAKFISTKNPTHHHFFLMAQMMPDQGLQIQRARSPHHFGRLNCQISSLLGTLSCSPGARFMITLSARCGLCIIWNSWLPAEQSWFKEKCCGSLDSPLRVIYLEKGGEMKLRVRNGLGLSTFIFMEIKGT